MKILIVRSDLCNFWTYAASIRCVEMLVTGTIPEDTIRTHLKDKDVVRLVEPPTPNPSRYPWLFLIKDGPTFKTADAVSI